MTTNEAKSEMHPEAKNFVNDFYRLSDEYNKLKLLTEDQAAHIAILLGDVEQYKKLVNEYAGERDYYMRLATEQQTHFKAIQALTVEADKCFRTAPFRSNGAPPTEQQQQVEQIQQDRLPKFLEQGPVTDEKAWK